MALTRPRAYQIYDIDYKQAVRVVTVADITLSGGAPNSVDGVNLSLNDRILVTGQTSGVQNGIYYVTTLGTGANGTWARSIDTDQTGELLSGTIVMVTEGNNYADTQWKLTTNDPITIGVTALTFVQNYSTSSISSGNSNVVVAANSSVTISSAGAANVIKVDATNISVTANIVPTANVAYSLGTATARFKDIYLANNSIYLGNLTIAGDSTQLTVNGANVVTSIGDAISVLGNVTGGNILTSGLVSATGNVTGSYIIGNGSQLTGLPAGYANSDVANLLASFGSNTISTTGNVTSGNLLTSGVVSSTGNITGNYILGNGSQLTGLPATYGNANVAAYLASGTNSSNIITTANVSGGNLATTGNVNGGNLNATTWVTSKDVSATGNAYINGFVSVVGNLYVANVISQGNLSVEDPLLYLTANTPYPYNYDIGFFSQFQTSPGDQTQANGYQHTGFVRDQTDNIWKLFSNVVPDPTVTVDFNNAIYDPILTGAVSAVGNITSTANVVAGNLLITTTVSAASHIGSVVSVTSNVTGGNILTAGLISATGNVSSAANVAGGNVLATTFISAASHIGSIVSVSSNITGGNILTGGLASATGNITSAANIAGDNVLATTVVSGASHIGSIVSVTANITGGNILTGGLISATGNVTGNYIFGNGSQLTGLPATYGNANVADYLASGTNSSNIITTGNVTGGNILTSGLISATGNITGNYFIGNGSQLTGISGGSSFVYTANTAPPASGNTVGAQWYNTSTGALYEYQSDGTSTYWVDITGPTVANTVTSTGDSLSPFLLMGA